LVFDWATVGAGLHLFCAVLAWSRWRFVAFAADERATTTLGLLAQALHGAGGVPTKLLTDRMACLKGGVVANVVVPTPDYVRFAAHYGFSPDFCHAQDRNDPSVDGHTGSRRRFASAVPQDRHVIDAVRPGYHPRDQGGYLQTRVRALVGGHGQEFIGQRPQTHHRSEFHDWDQASRRHQVWFVEHR